ncbi:UDP-N-acetylmuramoyl-tripeptide--D-alanyl-D-alanine ligase [Robertkochia aurantiaca]|uniref:UDP-N-acetylmuramoyl-tripeptide--D-alanyl-D- alanine ligase n=1 Tax=Robertkochia aurantiaca TaxID=2873700 RepID=UPI001CCA0D91|nr:UDP-N-acetylmuramoyl-tripeptide--D-alanyl-D-alanine ligase [Robertkochia sp. 3YJGBD-33]
MKIEAIHELFLNSAGITTDTRSIKPNTIFVALKGERFNGNDFALESLKQGASYAIVDENIDHANVRLIRVENTLKTLQDLATFHRQTLKLPVIALTGSNGKTTTKELIHAILAKRYRTVATRGNLNNHIGVPLTLLSFDEDTEIGIVEMGANHQKEIEMLCNIAYPDFGCITNYGKAHLEGFGGVEGVIKGKSEMYEHLMAHDKVIFFNYHDPVQQKKLKGYDKTYSFGDAEETNLYCRMIGSKPFVKLIINHTEIDSQLIGAYNYNNIALASAIGQYFGVSDEQIKEAVEAYVPQNNRSQIIEKNGKRIVLDAYNANPSSMLAALENFADTAVNSDRLAILGDMFELGESAREEHQMIADRCRELEMEKVYLVGMNFFGINTSYQQFRTYEDLQIYLQQHPPSESSLLIKGSRGMALERILNTL